MGNIEDGILDPINWVSIGVIPLEVLMVLEKHKLLNQIGREVLLDKVVRANNPLNIPDNDVVVNR